jgi:hypothetical protein
VRFANISRLSMPLAVMRRLVTETVAVRVAMAVDASLPKKSR